MKSCNDKLQLVHLMFLHPFNGANFYLNQRGIGSHTPAYLYEDFGARSRYLRQGLVIASHSILWYAWDILFWHQSFHLCMNRWGIINWLNHFFFTINMIYITSLLSLEWLCFYFLMAIGYHRYWYNNMNAGGLMPYHQGISSHSDDQSLLIPPGLYCH